MPVRDFEASDGFKENLCVKDTRSYYRTAEEIFRKRTLPEGGNWAGAETAGCSQQLYISILKRRGYTICSSGKTVNSPPITLA